MLWNSKVQSGAITQTQPPRPVPNARVLPGRPAEERPKNCPLPSQRPRSVQACVCQSIIEWPNGKLIPFYRIIGLLQIQSAKKTSLTCLTISAIEFECGGISTEDIDALMIFIFILFVHIECHVPTPYINVVVHAHIEISHSLWTSCMLLLKQKNFYCIFDLHKNISATQSTVRIVISYAHVWSNNFKKKRITIVYLYVYIVKLIIVLPLLLFVFRILFE